MPNAPRVSTIQSVVRSYINVSASAIARSNAVCCPGTVIKRCTAPSYSIRFALSPILSANDLPWSHKISLSAAINKVLGSCRISSSLHRPTLMAEQRLSALMVYARLKASMIPNHRQKPLSQGRTEARILFCLGMFLTKLWPGQGCLQNCHRQW